MRVKKRSGELEALSLDEITKRVRSLSHNLEYVDPDRVATATVSGLFDGVTTTKLDEYSAQIAASLITVHPNYGILAGRILLSNVQKSAPRSFSEATLLMHEDQGIVTDDHLRCVMAHREALDAAIVNERDMNYDYIAASTFIKTYLTRSRDKTVIFETPQYLFMRVAVGIFKDDLPSVLRVYGEMSNRLYIHASPTLCNAGKDNAQLSSCFLVDIQDDSLDGIYATLKDCSNISKYGGGIGLTVHKIRAKGSLIKGTNGESNGLVPMLKVYNASSVYADQGGNKRPGAVAVYLEPWHADVYDFLNLKKNNGSESMRARNLFYALWVPDLFMKCVRDNKPWYLMCPAECPGLQNVWGDEFERLYNYYVARGKYKKMIDAAQLMAEIATAQMETGTPYIVYKDHVNRKNNQMNLGTIQQSNLCVEVTEFTAPDETAVCNLASLCLPNYVDKVTGVDFKKLRDATESLVRNLNQVIDINYYPLKSASYSNMRTRPIGIGIQGLADLFAILKLPFDSPKARELNKAIAEHMYFAALTASNKLAMVQGTYPVYEGSPISKGILQFDMWNKSTDVSQELDWDTLRHNIKCHGVRNSLMIALMPTASTSLLTGFNEAFEPFTSNIYSRGVLSGEIVIINRYLVDDLIKLGLWNEKMKNDIIKNNGSIQNIESLKSELDLKALYKTVWEISQKVILQYAADRGQFTCQSQSMNIHMREPTITKITTMHLDSWSMGLKTGMYYLRTKASAQATKITIIENSEMVCKKDDPACMSCA